MPSTGNVASGLSTKYSVLDTGSSEWNFGLTDEQKLIVQVTKEFTEMELLPHEDEVEKNDAVPQELVEEIKAKAIAAGIYAANMPEEYGGGGLDSLTMALVERELGAASYAVNFLVARPSNILLACTDEQKQRYLIPTIKGDRYDCLALSEPDAGSDLRGMKCSAVRDGDDYVINGTKHFISHADMADYVILFVATGEEETARGPKKLITSLLVDMGTPGFDLVPGYNAVSNKGYHNFILNFDDCRVPVANRLGEEDKGFDVANEWLGSDSPPGGSHLPWPRPEGDRDGDKLGSDENSVRAKDRQVPGSVVQTG